MDNVLTGTGLVLGIRFWAQKFCNFLGTRKSCCKLWCIMKPKITLHPWWLGFVRLCYSWGRMIALKKRRFQFVIAVGGFIGQFRYLCSMMGWWSHNSSAGSQWSLMILWCWVLICVINVVGGRSACLAACGRWMTWWWDRPLPIIDTPIKF